MTESARPAPRSVRPSPEQAWEVIAKSHTGIFTTLRRDGSPISLPVWFVALENEIFISTPERAKKVARLRHDARAAFVVESGKRWAELLAVHLGGTARIIGEGEPLAIAAREAATAKYAAFRTERTEMPPETAGAYEKRGEHILICFTPQGRVLSWDNSALGL